MRTADLDYDLPPQLIAQHPSARREEARLLCLERRTGAVRHQRVLDLPEHLRAGDVLVVNDTRVRPARLRARRATGGAVELLLLEPAPQAGAGAWTALVSANRPPRPGEVLAVQAGGAPTGAGVRLLERSPGGPWTVAPADGLDLPGIMARWGELPLPPYIHRAPDDGAAAADRERYQTVYAREEGAVAAPTAGLHLTHALLDRVRERGVEVAQVTLHVGLGTFQPIAAETTEGHRMHAEAYAVPEAAAQAVRRARARGGRVVAVGTTSVRTLEAAALASPDGLPQAGRGSTSLFIEPGFAFRVVDALLTNFHLPRSTLLALVSALAGRERVLAAYREAVAQQYRFYSYGDAMLIA